MKTNAISCVFHKINRQISVLEMIQRPERADAFKRSTIRTKLIYWPDVMKNEAGDGIGKPLGLFKHIWWHTSRTNHINLENMKRGSGRPPASLESTFKWDIKTTKANFMRTK